MAIMLNVFLGLITVGIGTFVLMPALFNWLEKNEPKFLEEDKELCDMAQTFKDAPIIFKQMTFSQLVKCLLITGALTIFALTETIYTKALSPFSNIVNKK